MATQAAAGAVMAATTVASTAVNIYQSHEAGKAQEEARDVQTAQAEAEARKQRGMQLRQARIKQAQIQNIATQTGTQGSSGAIGATESISSQTNANLSFLDQSQRRARRTSNALQRAQNAATSSNVAANIASITLPYADFGSLYSME